MQRLLVSTSCITLLNPDLLSSRKTGVTSGRSWKTALVWKSSVSESHKFWCICYMRLPTQPTLDYKQFSLLWSIHHIRINFKISRNNLDELDHAFGPRSCSTNWTLYDSEWVVRPSEEVGNDHSWFMPEKANVGTSQEKTTVARASNFTNKMCGE